jgi:YidC/Oxa1 family membrane protein insertase
MDRRTILAFVSVMVIWIVYLYFFPGQQQQQRPGEKQKQKTEQSVKQTTAKTAPQPQRAKVSIRPGGKAPAEQKIEISTDKYNFVFSNRGAAIEKVIYKERDIDLVVKEGPHKTGGAIDFSLHFDEEQFLHGSSLDETNWRYIREDENTLKFYTTIELDGNPARIEKTYHFSKDKYQFDVDYKIVNEGADDITFNNNSVIISPTDILGPKLDYENKYNTQTSIYYHDGDFERASKGGGFMGCGGSGDNNVPIKHKVGSTDWIGIMSRYFLVIMIPQEFKGTETIYDNRENGGFRTGMRVRIDSIRPGTEITRSFSVYLGEKNRSYLEAVDEIIKKAADVNLLIEPIRRFVLWCLININNLIGNMGWSLVIFSLLTKLVFMPLTIKSTESMKRMSQLQPMVKELQAKYKDKQDVMNREVMKLYKDHKVNPLGGCLPLLLQMPFFFALYSALINSIDLWNAPFILWINDLSMPDTIATVSGFSINILPVLMAASTFLQQKLTPTSAGAGQQQKIMMMFMPVFLLYIFWTMPSGLVLYWTLQNAFQVAHQLIVNKWGKKEEE